DLAAVGKLNANGVLSGNWRENINSFGACRPRKVTLKTNNLVHAHALRRVNFVARNGWTFCDVTGPYGDSELSQRFNQNLLDLLEFGRICGCARFKIVFLEQINPG